MKILVAQIVGYGSYAKSVMLEKLQTAIEDNPGSEIFYLTCSNSYNVCYFNPQAKPEICFLCKTGVEKSLKLIKGKFHNLKIEDITTNADKNIAKAFLFENKSKIDEDLQFEHFKVGESAISTYISKSRDRELENINTSNTSLLILNAIEFYIALKRFSIQENFDVIYNFNGRHIYNRAVMDVGSCLNIPLYNLEVPRPGGYLEHFKDVLPHTIKYKQKLFFESWNNSPLPQEKKIEIGSKFFRLKREGAKIHGKIFTEKQNKNSLPQGIDLKNKNIVVYTSSDDEFAAVGKDFKNHLFKDQNEGLFYLVELFRNRFKDFNLIIRMHPNFSGVDFEYANKMKDLKGKYNNVHVVLPESSIDSYALLDIADKVMTFGSSITTEATFWRKPVIMLGRSFFSGLDIAYEVLNKEEIEGLLAMNLEPKNTNDSLVYGFYLLQGGEKAKYYFQNKKGKTYFKGKKIYKFSKLEWLKAYVIKVVYSFSGIRLFVK